MSNVSQKELKKLCMKNGRYCAICHTDLIINPGKKHESIIAVVSHIKGKKPGSARYDPSMSNEDRNSCENLILLCANHSKEIDDNSQIYTSEKLQQIKNEYETWVSQRLKTEIVNVTFAELAIVTKYLALGQALPPDTYTIIPPKEKIKKNDLSPKTEYLITMGMTQVKQVADFIDRCPDIDFGERLKKGFVDEYERLKNEEGLSGDDLFNSLLNFAAGESNDFKQGAAGLAVLVYLFEKCEVFEK